MKQNHEINGNTLNELAAFFQETERMKTQRRVAWLSDGTKESVAEHSWRLALMAMCLAPMEPGLDVCRVIKLSLVHDLGEADEGDVSAAEEEDRERKLEREKCCLLRLTKELPEQTAEEILALWQEYCGGNTAESRFVRGLDKLETIFQHNQGQNPPGFDYDFNLIYGRKWTQEDPILSGLRALADTDTQRRWDAENEFRQAQDPAGNTEERGRDGGRKV